VTLPFEILFEIANALFPKFLLFRGRHLQELRKQPGHWQAFCFASVAFRFDVPVANVQQAL
jgi:hypothetical protein